MKSLIIKAKPEDLKIIQELNLRLFRHEHSKFDRTLDTSWTFSKIGETYYLDKIKNKNSFAAIAEVGGEPVGYIVGSIKKLHYRTIRIAEIENMFVLEKFRSKGIGSKLVSAFKKWCYQNKVRKLHVGAIVLNKRAINFYKKQGFREYELYLET
jgi:GNAT superfamily N-acetyltransferase